MLCTLVKSPFPYGFSSLSLRPILESPKWEFKLVMLKWNTPMYSLRPKMIVLIRETFCPKMIILLPELFCPKMIVMFLCDSLNDMFHHQEDFRH